MYPKCRATSDSQVARRLLALGGCIASVLVPATAQADPYVRVTPSLGGAAEVHVGDSATGQLHVKNTTDEAPENQGHLKLTEMTLVPSCGVPFSDRYCAAPDADPGIITVRSGAVGANACDARSFPVLSTDAPSGRITFTPPPIDFMLNPTATCTISYTYDVNKMPTKDASALLPGTQTILVGFAQSTSSVSPFKVAHNTGETMVTVLRRIPGLIVRVPAQIVALGANISADVTVEATDPKGTIKLELFPPTDSSCAGSPIYSTTQNVTGQGPYSSAPVPSTIDGIYRWRATYSGDDNNDAKVSDCNDGAARTTVSAPVVVPPPPPPPPPPVAPGGGTGGTGGTGGGTTPGTGGTGSTTPGTKLPGTTTRVKLDKFGLTRRTFARATKATALSAVAAYAKKPKKAAKKGTQIKFTLSAPAVVTIVVERVIKGKRSSAYGNKCVKATKKLAKRKSCTLYTKVATLKRTFKTKGAKKVNFSGRAGRKVLAAGSYRLRAKASAGKGTESAERRITFKIVKR